MQSSDRHPGAVTATAAQGISEVMCAKKAAVADHIANSGSQTDRECPATMDLVLEDVTPATTSELDDKSFGETPSASTSHNSLCVAVVAEGVEAEAERQLSPVAADLVVEDYHSLPPDKDDKAHMVVPQSDTDQPKDERVIDFLARVPVLQSLDKSDLPLLAEAMKKETWPSGEAVIKQGDESSRLFIILSGKADIVLCNGSVCYKVVTLAAGDYFGERELLHEETARATVWAKKDLQLITYSITRDLFWQLGLHEKLLLPRRRAIKNWREDAHGSFAKSLAPKKTKADLDFLAKALRANAYLPSFCELTDGLVSELAEAASLRSADAGEVLMRQGDLHSCCLWIVQRGAFEIKGTGLGGSISALAGSWEGRVGAGDSFGELELLYSQPCAATVTALQRSSLWAISRSEFTTALDKALASRLEGYTRVLRGVNIFKGLYHEELRALAATLTEVSYKCGEDIITQGEVGDTCFVLVEGEVVVLMNGAEMDRRRASRAESKAELFGEEELLRPSPRVATVRVISESASVLALDKVTFELVLEPLSEILYAEKCGGSREPCLLRSPTTQLKTFVKRWSVSSTKSVQTVPRADLRLLGNLGCGAFGSVELAEDCSTGRRFALKRVERCKLRGSRECRQVLAEKAILQISSSPFLVKLYGTYRDANALSFLLELVTGGDLYHAYCLFGCYGRPKCAQFYTAGVALALEHLHQRHIVHRDIKPENVLLDVNGWPKVTDFGLAKFCVGKTYTRCGTPNYVAPEIVSEIGHGVAVDWWSLGVLMYEMMAAATPFESVDGDFLKTCKVSMSGIASPDLWFWPDGFGEILPITICSLLQPNPLRRLPMQPNGFSQFKTHQWFNSFDWAGFEAKKIQPPVTPKPLAVENLTSSMKEGDWNAAPIATTDWDDDF